MSDNSNHQQAEKIGRKKYMDMYGEKNIIEFSTYDYERWDFKQTAMTPSLTTAVGDIKNVNRDYAKYIHDGIDGGFLIDFDKCRAVKKEAKNDFRPSGLIVGFFNDLTIIWDIMQINWEERGAWRKVNKDGQDYGEKEWEYVTFLYLKEAVEIIRNDGIVS